MATEARTLRVGSALPDPPFEIPGDPVSGLDIDLTRAIARELGWGWELIPYEGADFEGIFEGLTSGRYDVVASGATITDHRRTLARWCRPYVHSGQSLVVNAERTPDATSVDHLAGLVIGVQQGNTSQPIAQKLAADAKVRAVAVYDYHSILTALDDLEAGTIGAFMKLEPVMRSLISERPALRIVQTGITTEEIGLAVALHDESLQHHIDQAQSKLGASGELDRLGVTWLAASDPRATRMAS